MNTALKIVESDTVVLDPLREITKEEREPYYIRERFLGTMTYMFKELALRIPELKPLVHNQKREGINKGQWGFYGVYVQTVTTLAILMTRLNLKSIVDLGSGPGFVMYGIKYMVDKANVLGFEIEKELINHSVLGFGNIKYQDILKVTKKQLADRDCIFFYEPFYDRGLAKQFAQRLNKVCTSGQYIFYAQAGSIGSEMQLTKRIKLVGGCSELQIYKVD